MAPNLADLNILEELTNDNEPPNHAEVYWDVQIVVIRYMIGFEQGSSRVT